MKPFNISEEGSYVSIVDATLEKNTLKVFYLSDGPNDRDLKRFLKARFPGLSKRKIKEIIYHEGWHDIKGVPTGIVDILFC